MLTVYFINLIALGANTSAGKAVEPTWKALLAPENADRAMIASPLYSGAAAYQLGVLTRSEGFGWEFYEGMKANAVAVGKGNGSIITAVAIFIFLIGLVGSISPVTSSPPRPGRQWTRLWRTTDRKSVV